MVPSFSYRSGKGNFPRSRCRERISFSNTNIPMDNDGFIIVAKKCGYIELSFKQKQKEVMSDKETLANIVAKDDN